MKKNTQAISLDLILAIFIFMIIMVGFFYIVNNMTGQKTSTVVKVESEYLPRMLEENSSSTSFVEGNKIKVSALYNLTGKNYTELKNELGMKNDFCIYFVDEEGYLVKINNKTGLGSPRFKINNTPCGSS
jgi:hypothetical protein